MTTKYVVTVYNHYTDKISSEIVVVDSAIEALRTNLDMPYITTDSVEQFIEECRELELSVAIINVGNS